MSLPAHELTARARRVRLLLLDVDGVLTDGLVFVTAAGDEAKGFSIRDGAGLVWAQRLGIEVGLLSGRASGATLRRAAELGITMISQDSRDKLSAYKELIAAAGVDDEEVAYMGDDLLDLPVLRRVALAAAPADAADEVRRAAHWVSGLSGGRGAVREFVEVLLRAQDKWDPLLQSFAG